MTFTPTINPDFPEVKDIHPTDASKISNAVWIDVRTAEEYSGELSHIKGTRLIPVDQIPQRVNEIEKSGTKIFVCRSGQRSAKACKFLQELGYKDCYNLQGGMLLWNQLQLPIETEG